MESLQTHVFVLGRKAAHIIDSDLVCGRSPVRTNIRSVSGFALEKYAKIPAVYESSFEIMHVLEDLETRVICFREIIYTSIRNYRTRAIPVKQSSGDYDSGTRRCASLLDVTPQQSQFCIALLRCARLLETRIWVLFRALARVRCCSVPRCVRLNA